jgi:hypothetical protein
MTIEEICNHERANMFIRHHFGYDQHDYHVWCWLLYHLDIWSRGRPIRIIGDSIAL